MSEEKAILQNQRGDIAINVGDAEFVLEPTLRNIDAVETVLKKPFTQLIDELREKKLFLTTAEFATFLFVTQKEPKRSFNKIRTMIHEHGTFSVISAVAQFATVAIAGAMPSTEDGDGGEGNEKAKTS